MYVYIYLFIFEWNWMLIEGFIGSQGCYTMMNSLRNGGVKSTVAHKINGMGTTTHSPVHEQMLNQQTIDIVCVCVLNFVQSVRVEPHCSDELNLCFPHFFNVVESNRAA